jgi:Flp pilus assembly protein TadG
MRGQRCGAPLRSPSRHPLRSQRGAEIVEFAITLPVILIVFFIFVDFGIAFSDQAVIANASRAAAREAIRGSDNAAAYAAANAVLTSLSSWTGGGSHTCDADKCTVVRAGTGPGDDVTVTITFPFHFLLLSDRADLNIAGRAVMRMLPH